jgi:hypothetical protein
MRMLRWPPARLLVAPGRLRLATLLTGRPSTVYDLQQDSGESLAACRVFFDDLTTAHLLMPAPTPTLIALERTAYIASACKPLTKKNPAPASLLARIRHRLRQSLSNLGASGQTSRA